MKKIKIYLIGQKYEIELEDDFYEYIQEDINKLNNSNNQIKDLLHLFLEEKFLSYKNNKKIISLLKKLEK